MTARQDAMLTGSCLFGAFVGMIGFGAAAEYMGRRCLFITTGTLVGVASLGCAFAHPISPLGLSIFSVLSICRFIVGLGIGGEYPLAAATTVENTDAAASSRSLAIVFSGACLGGLLAPGFVMLLAGPLDIHGSRLWRFSFGFGAILALLVASLRILVLKETHAWQAASESEQVSVRSRVQTEGRTREKIG